MAAISSLPKRAPLALSLFALLLSGIACGDADPVAPSGGRGTTVTVGGGSPEPRWWPMRSGTEELLWGVSGSGDGDAVAVGTRATALHLTDAGWREAPSNEVADFCDVTMSASGSAIAVGLSGTAAAWDGGEWRRLDTGTGASLFSVHGFANGYSMAVGDTGTIIGYDGAAWSPIESGAGVSLFGVWGDSVSNAFAVGVGGTIMNFDGTAWSFMTTATTENLSAVWGTSGTDVWAVGDRGTILHYDGAAWTGMTSGTEANLYDVWGGAPGDVWAVGAMGTILHYDGTGWSRFDSPVVTGLYGLWGDGKGDTWAVGEAGVILRYGLADNTVYYCHDHPDGGASPPSYGLRIDDLIDPGQYTFSFDHADTTGSAVVTLIYDADMRRVHIRGRVFGGRVVNDAWDPGASGWADIDFTYVNNVSFSEACGEGDGDDIYVTGQSAANRGSVSLVGWGDDATYQLSDLQNEDGCSFMFDNDTDSKGNDTIASDPAVWSGSGWLRPREHATRDWLFVAEKLPEPVP